MFISRTSQLFILLFALAIALSTASFVSGSISVSPADRSYDNVEQLRVSRFGASTSSLASDDEIENVRLQRSLSLTVDTSYDSVEQVRMERGLVADRSYDIIEAIRLLR